MIIMHKELRDVLNIMVKNTVVLEKIGWTIVLIDSAVFYEI